MIKVVSKHYVKENKIQEFVENAARMVEATRKEEGCISYGLFQDDNDPKILTFIEEWESKEALEKHKTTEHFTNIVPILKKLDEKPGELNIYNQVL
ncbi:Quinol monooxygenase YgiN [Lutispora thermophila DSM 19022]|uniref:Quinol monooxygenase YgiN n=2 Tax=Lutispora TaxID=667112 RepID=A0A1M6HC53_9FIRM|nr:Quinol monooxygenase YgiN [Lutispora thermophila DSM 19022]